MTYPILLTSHNDAFTEELKAEFIARRPDITVLLANDKGSEQVEVAVCWHPDHALLSTYPKLQFIHSAAAGVDNLGHAILESGLPICRIVDEQQKVGMFEYILWGVLNTHRKFDEAQTNQHNKHWHRYTQRTAASVNVSVLGLGELGGYVAQRLAEFGYSVSGWSRSQKSLDGITCYSGAEGLDQLLEQSEILINLLPLNESTSGILKSDLFNQMPAGGYLINCGRGHHLITDDLMKALELGQLRGALLDVFEEEPLPATNPLWTTQGVIVTPHVASDASISGIIDQVADNVLRYYHQEALQNQFDPAKGY